MTWKLVQHNAKQRCLSNRLKHILLCYPNRISMYPNNARALGILSLEIGKESNTTISSHQCKEVIPIQSKQKLTTKNSMSNSLLEVLCIVQNTCKLQVCKFFCLLGLDFDFAAWMATPRSPFALPRPISTPFWRYALCFRARRRHCQSSSLPGREFMQHKQAQIDPCAQGGTRSSAMYPAYQSLAPAKPNAGERLPAVCPSCGCQLSPSPWPRPTSRREQERRSSETCSSRPLPAAAVVWHTPPWAGSHLFHDAQSP